MENEQIKNLCLSLMHSDMEAEVIALLKKAGYWDDSKAWRYYGDRETNFNTIGNQQDRSDAALVEKIVNSVDACIVNECLIRDIDPEGPSAPQSIQQAVAQFFGEGRSSSTFAGRIREWTSTKRTEIARNITLSAIGVAPSRGGGNPCFTIADAGEGQTPDMMPKTFLSLDAKNKVRIPFVQGQYNMGGTGVLQFCGRHKLQLIISRRNPRILGRSFGPTDNYWGFTIVRREDPKGGLKLAVYTYLAPIDAAINPNSGGVLRFKADKMPIFPERNEAYKRESQWGTLIKLYEYSVPGFRGNIILPDGALGRLDIRLPDIALPVRLHECRKGYKGHAGSFDTTLTGIGVRLDEDKAQNVEEGFPSSSPMSVMGQYMTITIYAFKKGKSGTYRKNEGIIFTVNGQTQGYLTTDFFRREKIGLSYLRDSILVMIDCTKFDEIGRADLFMNNRVTLRKGELSKEIENELEDLLKNNENLKALKERRKREEIESTLDEDKPLEDILKKILKQSPSLSSIFLLGKRLSTPFKTKEVLDKEVKYIGRKHPTYFKFKGKDYGHELHKDCHINYRARITFETDAVNDYFSRDIDRGESILFLVEGENKHLVTDYTGPNLQNGIATLNVKLPQSVKIGDCIHFISIISDPTLLAPFENTFNLNVLEEAQPSGEKGSRRKPPVDEEGKDREHPTGISMPDIKLVEEKQWNDYYPPFNKYTALRIKSDINEDGKTIYYFFINMDNIYLKTELKYNSLDPDLMKARYKYGMVILGLALLHNHAESNKLNIENADSEEENVVVNIEDKIEEFTRAVALVLIPMISTLGESDLKESYVDVSSGEVT
jgi:hypothetical protein